MYWTHQIEPSKSIDKITLSNSQQFVTKSLLTSEPSAKCDQDCLTYTNRLHRYCHASLINAPDQIVSNEGKLTNDQDGESYELAHVHIIARHGDRTPVSVLRLGSPVYYECGMVDNSFNWNGLDDFDVHFLAPGREPLIQLNPGSQNKECGDFMGMGKLTALGFKQHAFLGKLLRKKYSHFVADFIDNVQSLKRNVYVQSTQVLRTIHSLSAFLLGFLSDSMEVRRAVTMHISQGTLLQLPPIGISKFYKQCHGYVKLWENDRSQTGFIASVKEQRHLITELCGMFGLASKCETLSVPKVFEQLSIRGCHDPSNPLPCLGENCVSYSQALELFLYTDWVWANAHPRMSSIIATMPLLNHSVLAPMERIIDSNQEGTFLPGSYRLMVSLTHDNTISKMLTNLGVTMQEWMPYATRVVFELWRKKTTNLYEVRILLNGEVISVQCGGWGRGMNRELIPYADLKEFLLSGKYRNLMAYSKICRTA